jgi:purine-binding chemotaxis protein CheW
VAQVQLVTFRLGAEEFGVDVFKVHEILRYQPVTPIPRAPRFVEGVLDVRGAVIPVLDLRKRFELARVDTDDDSRIVLVDFEGERMGLVVDAVTEVLRVPETMLAPPPRYFKGLAQEFIRGIVRMDSRLVVLIDLDQVLSSEERIALHEIDFAAARAEGAPTPAPASPPPASPPPASPGAAEAGVTTDASAGSGEAGGETSAAALPVDAADSTGADADGADGETGADDGAAKGGRAKRGGKRA